MTSTSGTANIRGLNIDKLAKGYADEELLLKKFVSVASTNARELRWYQKTAGFLTVPAANAPTSNVSQLALPSALEQSWTRKTSYVRKYFAESPLISMEDIKDSDVDILAGNLRDIVRHVSKQVDERIFNVLTEGQSAVAINSVVIDGGKEWNAEAGQDPIADLLSAKEKIRDYSYNPEGAILLLSPKDHTSLVSWIVSVKGMNIPGFSSERMGDGVVMGLLGLRVVVSTNVTADYAAVFVPQRAATWKSFMPITARTIEEVGIGTKIRVWEEGEALLTDPRAVTLISNTQV